MPIIDTTENNSCVRESVVQVGTGTEPILGRLRRETSQLHAEVERRVDILNRVRSLENYRTLLEKFYGLHCSLEAQIYTIDSPVRKWLPDLELRRRTTALRSDLAMLGNADPDRLPLAPCQSLETAAQHFGCLYVMEGSTLGGQVIARHVHERLGLTSGNGCDFFMGHGVRTGALWERFRDALGTFATCQPVAHEEIVLAATRIFNLFGNWMEPTNEAF